MANSGAAYAVEEEQVKMADNRMTASDREKIVGMFANETEYKAELINRIVNTCFIKCIDARYKEGELYTGEISCINRCVSKYWQVNNIVGHVLKSHRPSM